MAAYEFPDFDQLPSVPGQPQGCLWGFFDRGGEKDELGSEFLLGSLSYRCDTNTCVRYYSHTIAINLLNDETVKKAALEIQTGRHVQLDWPLNNVEFPGFGRIPMEHNVKEMEKEGFVGLDDEIKINTQTSSQWDSLKHASVLYKCTGRRYAETFGQWSIQSEGVFYNGLSIKEALQSPRNGLHSKTLSLSRSLSYI